MKKTHILFCLCILTGVVVFAQTGVTKLPQLGKDPLGKVIAAMTLEEKAALCTGEGPWATTPVERLGIPRMTVTDGPHGVRRAENISTFIEKSLPATCFPTASCMASTWDVDLIHKVGEALAEECIGLNVDVILDLGRQKAEDAYEQWLKELRQKAKVRINKKLLLS
jgi:beta-glucosidase